MYEELYAEDKGMKLVRSQFEGQSRRLKHHVEIRIGIGLVHQHCSGLVPGRWSLVASRCWN